MFLSFLLCFSLGYLSGSIPFGFLLAKFVKKSDIRQEGSGNIGATNVFRCAGKALGLLTFFLDMLKAAIPVFLFSVWTPNPDAVFSASCVALGTMAGHLFPCWLRFKGGKGVAPFIGVMLAFSLSLGLAMITIWIMGLIVTRTSSASSLIMTGSAPILTALFLPGTHFAETTLILSLFIWWRHQDNLKRLWSGAEKPIVGSKT